MFILPKPSYPLLGAHTSASGGLQNAIYEGQQIGASTIQLFTANQRQWRRRPINSETLSLFQKSLENSDLSYILSHGSYLINPGCPKQDILEKSRLCLYQEVQDCINLGISMVNFHPGAALHDDTEACLNRIIHSFSLTANLFENNPPLIVLLETTAGQGSLVGKTFEELAFLIQGLKNTIPIGICLDTCHIFAAGYNIASPSGWDQVLEKFDETIGLSYLYAIHLNDSVFPCGSYKDRHAPIGEGFIGMESFQYVMQNPLTTNIPKYLETPGGPDLWEKEIKLLNKF